MIPLKGAPCHRKAVGHGYDGFGAAGNQIVAYLLHWHVFCCDIVAYLQCWGTSPIATDSLGHLCPTSSLVITMLVVLGAIPSLHPRHKMQCLLFFQHCSCDCTTGSHKTAARAADPSFGILPEIEGGDRGMIGDRLEESWRALAVSPMKIKEYYSYNQSNILDLWY